jgi:hypothetical protein
MIPEVNHHIRGMPAQVGPDRFERPNISMNIGDNRDSHIIIIGRLPQSR